MDNLHSQTFVEFIQKQTCITELEYILEILPNCGENGPWIAGGAMLRTYTGGGINSDVDVFFQNKEQFDAYVEQIKTKAYTGDGEKRNLSQYTIVKTVVNEWHTTITLNYHEREWKIQCVNFVYFKNISELFDSFDFNICMMAYDGDKVYTYKDTLESIDAKKLKLKKVNYPSVTLKRLVKYMRQGYDVEDSVVMLLANSFRNIKKEPKSIVAEHFGGENEDNSSDYKSLN